MSQVPTILYNSFAGRIGRICDKFYLNLNETDAGTDTAARFDLPEHLVLWMDECTRELANDRLWEEVLAYDISAGITDYNWAQLLPDTVQVFRVALASPNEGQIVTLTDWHDYVQAKRYFGSATAPIGVYTEGFRSHLIGTPSANVAGGFLLSRSYLPVSPGPITLSAAAVVNNGDGTVAFAATNHGMLVGAEINLVMTNYTGQYWITAITSNTFSVTATYTAYTVAPATDKCFLQPQWPSVYDNVLRTYLEKQHVLRDATNKKWKGWLTRDLEYPPYYKARVKLINAGLPRPLQIRCAKR